MTYSTKNRATIVRLVALALMLATLLATLLSPVPASAAVSSGKAFAWGTNGQGQLGNNAAGTNSSTPDRFPTSRASRA